MILFQYLRIVMQHFQIIEPKTKSTTNTFDKLSYLFNYTKTF